MSIPRSVRIVEVGPRDGLQNEPGCVSLEAKVGLVEQLADAGLKIIECGSFVSARRVPQMADTAQVFQTMKRKPGVCYSALVPNLEGLTRAAECKLEEVAVFVSASESFSQANVNCSIEESLIRTEAVIRQAHPLRLRVRGYVSCVLGCPYEGQVGREAVARVARQLVEMGCYEVSLGDTIGVGTPLLAQRMLEAVRSVIPAERIAVHFHDTWGQALANILASLELGVATVDSSVAGLGGCPYAPGAAGNVATEDVIYMLDGMGVETGVDLKRLAAAGREIMRCLGRTSSSKAATAMLKSQ